MLKQTGAIDIQRGGNYVLKYFRPPNPTTANQLVGIREYVSVLTRNWSLVSEILQYLVTDAYVLSLETLEAAAPGGLIHYDLRVSQLRLQSSPRQRSSHDCVSYLGGTP